VGVRLPFVLTAVLSGQVAAADQAVLESLMRMQNALHDLSYSGTLVYAQDGKVQSMHVIHQFGKSGEREKLVNLNGEPREIVRDDDIVTCYRPDKKEATVGKRHHNWGVLSRLVKNDFSSLQKMYEFTMEPDDRVAGQKTKRILIKPRDNLRYGYRLWLDSTNSLLLKSDLLDTKGHTIEQVMFTDIKVVNRIPEEMLEPSYNREEFKWLEQSHLLETQSANGEKWKFHDLPEGFTISNHARKRLPSDDQPTDHWIATDGLATVSIYVEKMSDKEKIFQGSSRSGAMSIYGLPKEGYQVTVVGEVPEKTAEKIARSISK